MARRSPENYLCQDWDEHFMTMALAFSKLSSNPYTQVGACIVNKSKQVIGHGYNGVHRLIWQDQFCWYTGPKDQRYIWVPHAEVSALYNRYVGDIRGYTMYVTLFPCYICAQNIINHGITRVVYLWDHNNSEGAKTIFDNAGVTYGSVRRNIRIYYKNFEME